MSKSKKLLGVLLASVLIFNTIAIGASAVLNDGNMLSADINLEIGTVSGSVFTPLETGTALHAGDVITVRICPTSDFYCGVSRYVVMFSSAYLSIEGTGKDAFIPNMANAFYTAVALDYGAATTIPATAWPTSMLSLFDTYTAVAVNNTANSYSGNGGYPDFLPGDWFFSFELTVTQDITPLSGARIWMDNQWFRNPSNPTGAAYFAKCTSADQLSVFGSSSIYNFNIDLTGADINLDPFIKITFNSAGGSAVAPVTGYTDSAIPAITAPTKPGYTFLGWSPALPATLPSINTTYTAQWHINTYNAHFKVDGKIFATVPTIYNSAIAPPSNPVKAGYTFMGWDYIPATMPANDIVINAIWSRIPVTLSAKAGSTTIFDQNKGFISGLEEGMPIGTFLSSFVTVNGDGRLAYHYYMGSFGTQTKIDLIDNVTGLVVKTYYIVIYGDVNGDGNIDSIDAGIMVDHENYMTVWDPVTDAALYKAADLNGDGNVDSIDAGIAVDAQNYVVTIDQTTGLAAPN